MNTNNQNTEYMGICSEQNYASLLAHIEKSLRFIFSNNVNLDELNPLAKRDILNAIAINSNIKQFFA